MPTTELQVTYPNLPDEYMREIGRVALSWNFLESLIVHTLVLVLLGDFATDMRAVSVFIHMNYGQKMDALNSMLKIASPEIAEVFAAKVKPLLEECAKKRNMTLHQTWLPLEDGVIRFNIQAKGTFKATHAPVPIRELEAISPYIMEAHATMLSLVTIPMAPKETPQSGQ